MYIIVSHYYSHVALIGAQGGNGTVCQKNGIFPAAQNVLLMKFVIEIPSVVEYCPTAPWPRPKPT